MVRRVITLEVSDGFEFPEGFAENAERILEYGCEVYRRMGEVCESEEISRLQEKHKREEERYKMRLEELKEKIRSHEEELKAERRLERDEICRYMEDGRHQRDSEIQYLKDQLEEQRQRIQVTSASQQDGVSQRLTALFTEIQAYNSYVGASTAQKGAVGESFVYNYLCQHFPNYVVTDTSKNASSMSDMYMESTDQKYKILVEVKNVTTLTATDRTKFEYDIETCGKGGKINGAILYSLNPANIHSRWFNLVYHSNIPTLYISNVKASPEMMRYGIFVMEELIKRSGMYNASCQMEEEHNDFVRTMDMLYRSAEEELKSLERDRRILLSLEDQYKERQRRVSAGVDQMRGVMERYGMEVDLRRVEVVEGKCDLQTRMIARIQEASSGQDIKQKTLIDLGFKPVEIVKAGGIREIKSLLKVSKRIEVEVDIDECAVELV